MFCSVFILHNLNFTIIFHAFFFPTIYHYYCITCVLCTPSSSYYPPSFLLTKTSKHPLPHNIFLPTLCLFFSRNAPLSFFQLHSLLQVHSPFHNTTLPPNLKSPSSLHTPSPVTASWANLVLQGNPTTFLLIPPPNEVTRYEAPGVVVGEEEEKIAACVVFTPWRRRRRRRV